MTGIGIGLGLAFSSRRVPHLSPQGIAQALTSPADRKHLFVVGDSRMVPASRFAVATPEIPWVGSIDWGSQTLGDAVGVHESEGVAASGADAPTSPLIGGDATWFPNGDIEAQFLGGTEGATVLNTRLATCGFTTARFPRVIAACVGHETRVRTIAVRRTGAPSSLPGVRVVAAFDYGQGFGAPNCIGDTITDLTGSGYVELHATIPADHDWNTYPNVSQDIAAVPNAATVAGETFAYHQPWLEAQRAGIVCITFAVTGSGIERWLDDAVMPVSLWTEFVPVITGGKPAIFWIDLGTNNGAENTTEQHAAKLELLMARIRTGNPRHEFILTTAYPTSTDGATTYYRDAAFMVAARVPGVYLIDTHPMWSYAAADAAGHMGDVTHYTEAGSLALHERISDVIDLTANPPGRVDYTGLATGIGPATLPGRMVVTSGVTANRSVQTGTSTMVQAVTQNRGRLGRYADADAVGLALQGARTNRFTSFGQVGSGETYTASTGLVGPDGAGDSPRFQITSGGYSRYFTVGPVTNTTYVDSQWERAFAGATSAQVSANAAASGGNITAAWTRRRMRDATGSTARALMPADGRNQAAIGGIAAGARDVCAMYHQCEDGNYATEYIPAGQTRDAETHAFPHVLQAYLVAGRLHLGIRHRPLAAPSLYAGTPILWYSDANNQAYFTPATGVVTVVIAGVAYSTSSGATWAAGDTVEWYLACAGGVAAENTIVKYRVNGGSVTAWNSAAPQGGIAATPLYVIADGTNVFASIVETVDIGVTPDWAA